MKIFTDVSSWKRFKDANSTKSIGFVPTMGNLHQGHSSLIEQSQKHNDLSVISIFVNPTQFNKRQDFKNYPKTLEKDTLLLESLGVDCLFLPDEKLMYQDNFTYQVNFIDNNPPIMENLYRPGHFTGVLTIVMKLLNIIRPNNCYFGKKDYQQLHMIKQMVQAFYMDEINIIGCETIRHDSGLAYSSRNNLLSSKEKELALKAANIFHDESITDNEKFTKIQELGIKIEYLENHYQRKFIAFNVGNIRLIDNYAVLQETICEEL